MKEKITECERRLSELRNTTDKANFMVRVELDGEMVEVLGTVMLVRAAQELIVHIGDCHELTKESDLRKTIEMQSIEGDSQTLSLPPL